VRSSAPVSPSTSDEQYGKQVTENGEERASSVRRAGQPWLQVVRRYLLFIAVGNMLWEFAQMPGFADWREAGWT
jgi:hypothetical protein